MGKQKEDRAQGSVHRGTGRCPDATDTLALFRHATADRSGFVGNIRGELCLSGKN